MKYTVSEAAKIVGITRQTIYRHIDTKPLTIEKDENGNQLIDASELMRVYGNDINFDALDETVDTPANATDVTKSGTVTVTSIEDQIEIVRLKAELDKEKALRNGTEEENQYIKNLLEEEKAERKKANNLLEDMRSKDEQNDKWEKTLKALENRIANQERAAKEKEEREQKILRQNRSLKKALTEEKNKSIWQKLFG